jgi:hypothetical protein
VRKPRDYAKERAQRDAKYRVQGFKSYNDRETKRRNANARSEGFVNSSAQRKWLNEQAKTLGFPTHGARLKAERKVLEDSMKVRTYLDNLADQLAAGMNPADIDIDDPLYWQAFKANYERVGVPA